MNKYFKFLFAAVAVVSFTSCLKDKEFDDHIYGHSGLETGKVIELGIANSPAHSGGVAFDFIDQSVSKVAVTVRLSAAEVASEDILVTLDTAHAIVDTFAARGGRTIKVLPASFYSFDGTGMKVTIKKGEREGTVVIKTNAIQFDPSTTYGLGFKIVSVDKPGYTIAANFREWVTTIQAKNKYDGIYEANGTYQDVTNAAFTGRYPFQYQLITTGPATCIVSQLINSEIVPGYLFSNAGSGSFYGSYGLVITFDQATDKIAEIHNYYGEPGQVANGIGDPSTGSGPPLYIASNTRRAVLDPTGINAYDGDKKIITIKHFMLQPSSVPAGPRVKLDETWTYVKSR